MADLKTILRETSVIFGLKNKPVAGITAQDYIEFLKENIVNYKALEKELEKITVGNEFNNHQQILTNGFNIGQSILNRKQLKGNVVWMGAQVKNEYPYDISIGDYGVSLKEESYILKNPALADYLNSLTQYNPPFKAVHIFREFAPELFEAWFDYTLRSLFATTKDGDVIYDNEKRECKLIRGAKNVTFTCDDTNVTINEDEKLTEKQFNNKVGGYLIEYVFAKWISDKMSKDAKYLELKKACSEKAGENIIAFIKQNMNIDKKKILALFQIYDIKYLYAKHGNPPILLEVPSINDVDFDIINIESSVPKSQLNVLFKFRFKSNGKESDINVRVECRYSHGQFKGIPEAKLYYENQEEINNIYNAIP